MAEGFVLPNVQPADSGAFPWKRPPTGIVSLPIPALIVLAFIVPYFRRFPICRLGRPCTRTVPVRRPIQFVMSGPECVGAPRGASATVCEPFLDEPFSRDARD